MAAGTSLIIMGYYIRLHDPAIIVEHKTGVVYAKRTLSYKDEMEGFIVPLPNDVELIAPMLDPDWWQYCQGSPDIDNAVGRWNSQAKINYKTRRDFMARRPNMLPSDKRDVILQWLRQPRLEGEALWEQLGIQLLDLDLSSYGIYDFKIAPNPEPKYVLRDKVWVLENKKERHREGWVRISFGMGYGDESGVLTWRNYRELYA